MFEQNSVFTIYFKIWCDFIVIVVNGFLFCGFLLLAHVNHGDFIVDHLNRIIPFKFIKKTYYYKRFAAFFPSYFAFL